MSDVARKAMSIIAQNDVKYIKISKCNEIGDCVHSQNKFHLPHSNRICTFKGPGSHRPRSPGWDSLSTAPRSLSSRQVEYANTRILVHNTVYPYQYTTVYNSTSYRALVLEIQEFTRAVSLLYLYEYSYEYERVLYYYKRQFQEYKYWAVNEYIWVVHGAYIWGPIRPACCCMACNARRLRT